MNFIITARYTTDQEQRKRRKACHRSSSMNRLYRNGMDRITGTGSMTVWCMLPEYWYWNSRGRKINALDYLIEIRGYGLADMKGLYRMLKALEMEYWKAKEIVCSRKGYWRMAEVLNQIFSKKIIAKLGYTPMLDYYLVVCEN